MDVQDSPLVRRIGLGAAALRYVSLNYAVLPLAAGGKRPHAMLGGSGGVHHATTDPRWVEWWWAQDPRANIGVATGRPSGLLVVDLDTKNGADGAAGLRNFLYQIGDPWTREPGLPGSPWAQAVARTPSGGWHIWLRAADSPERPGILPGVDVKGTGGYVVAPPSMLLRSGMARGGEPAAEPVPVPYRWSWGCPCQAPPAPGWMPGWLAAAPVRAYPGGGEYAGDTPSLEEAARTGLARGERNREAYRLACSLYRRYGVTGDGQAAVTEGLRRVWDATEHADFPWREVLVCIASARKYVAQQEAAELAAWQSWNRSGQ